MCVNCAKGSRLSVFRESEREKLERERQTFRVCVRKSVCVYIALMCAGEGVSERQRKREREAVCEGSEISVCVCILRKGE